MYGELYELTSAFGSFVERAYGNTRRLERLYATLDGGSLHDHAAAARLPAGIERTLYGGGVFRCAIAFCAKDANIEVRANRHVPAAHHRSGQQESPPSHSTGLFRSRAKSSSANLLNRLMRSISSGSYGRCEGR